MTQETGFFAERLGKGRSGERRIIQGFEGIETFLDTQEEEKLNLRESELNLQTRGAGKQALSERGRRGEECQHGYCSQLSPSPAFPPWSKHFLANLPVSLVLKVKNRQEKNRQASPSDAAASTPFVTHQPDVTISIHHLSSVCGNFQCQFILTQLLLPKGNCFTTELQKQHSPALGKEVVLFSCHTWIQSRT